MSSATLMPLVTGNRALTIGLFLAVVALTLGITFWATRQNKTAADYYAGGRSFSGFQNGLAIGGDYMSAASFLGISGAIALYGYDGFLYSIGFLVAWLVALLLVAELLRNSGRYTMADQLAYRMRQTPVRTAAATSTIVVSIFYLLAQMVGAGALQSTETIRGVCLTCTIYRHIPWIATMPKFGVSRQTHITPLSPSGDCTVSSCIWYPPHCRLLSPICCFFTRSPKRAAHHALGTGDSHTDATVVNVIGKTPMVIERIIVSARTSMILVAPPLLHPHRRNG